RHWYAPDRSIDSLFNGNRRFRRHIKDLNPLLEKLHILKSNVKLVTVEHQLAHASSCYHLNESPEKTAIFCIDSKGEYSNIFLGYGENGKIKKIKEFYNPDSLCGMYAALTDYLGFEILDGEFKAMGIAPFGDPNKYDLSSLASFGGSHFKVNNKLISTIGLRRYRAKSRGHYFSKKLVAMLGPRRAGNLLEDPYVHYAAAIQKLYEDIALVLVTHYLKDILEETGRLAIAGTGSMNIRLNQRLRGLPFVNELIVHPACGDSGTAIGAASYAVRQSGIKVQAVNNMFLGPGYNNDQCIDACVMHREKPQWELLENPHEKAAELLTHGQLVAWFRGRMEFGPRALGNRSILANPTQQGIADAINHQVKFREHWRPFSPSMLDTVAENILPRDYRNNTMCMSSPVSAKWQEQYPVVICQDGTTRAQIVTEQECPDFYRLLQCFQQLTGHGLLINASLSRPGEALICTPENAVDMFMGTDLNYMIMENVLVTKREAPDSW
ncbi:MAG: carbamoyltransferase C-terminal domain-containing protein, partial [Gammaproteobacteria bacterium]|nr:carbamoyltransferase C-terminal domain-containing protein [Gammaproteobacteria bacterium]